MGEQKTAFYILPDKAGTRVWMTPAGDGWTLPSCTWSVPEGVDAMINPDAFNRALARQIDGHVSTLFAFHWRDAEADERVRIFSLDTHDRDPAIGGRWIKARDLENLRVPTLFRSVLETWSRERSYAEPSAIEPWCLPGWMSRVGGLGRGAPSRQRDDG